MPTETIDKLPEMKAMEGVTFDPVAPIGLKKTARPKPAPAPDNSAQSADPETPQEPKAEPEQAKEKTTAKESRLAGASERIRKLTGQKTPEEKAQEEAARQKSYEEFLVALGYTDSDKPAKQVDALLKALAHAFATDLRAVKEDRKTLEALAERVKVKKGVLNPRRGGKITLIDVKTKEALYNVSKDEVTYAGNKEFTLQHAMDLAELAALDVDFIKDGVELTGTPQQKYMLSKAIEAVNARRNNNPTIPVKNFDPSKYDQAMMAAVDEVFDGPKEKAKPKTANAQRLNDMVLSKEQPTNAHDIEQSPDASASEPKEIQADALNDIDFDNIPVKHVDEKSYPSADPAETAKAAESQQTAPADIPASTPPAVEAEPVAKEEPVAQETTPEEPAQKTEQAYQLAPFGLADQPQSTLSLDDMSRVTGDASAILSETMSPDKISVGFPTHLDNPLVPDAAIHSAVSKDENYFLLHRRELNDNKKHDHFMYIVGPNGEHLAQFHLTNAGPELVRESVSDEHKKILTQNPFNALNGQFYEYWHTAKAALDSKTALKKAEKHNPEALQDLKDKRANRLKLKDVLDGIEEDMRQPTKKKEAFSGTELHSTIAAAGEASGLKMRPDTDFYVGIRLQHWIDEGLIEINKDSNIVPAYGPVQRASIGRNDPAYKKDPQAAMAKVVQAKAARVTDIAKALDIPESRAADIAYALQEAGILSKPRPGNKGRHLLVRAKEDGPLASTDFGSSSARNAVEGHAKSSRDKAPVRRPAPKSGGSLDASPV